MSYTNDETPYVYHSDKLGIEGRCLFSGRGAHPNSLQLVSDRGLRQRILRGLTVRLRAKAPGVPMLVRFDSIPRAWQEAAIRVWGNPPAAVRQTLFERYYERDAAAFDYYTLWRSSAGAALKSDLVEKYVLQASVLNTAKKIYEARYRLRREYNIEVGSIWEVLSTEICRYKALSGHTLPDNYSYLRRKYNAYVKEGYQSLVSGKHSNNNARKVDAATEQLLNSMFASQINKPSPADVAAQYNGFLAGYVEVVDPETGECFSPEGFASLAESTVRSYLLRWSNKIATYARRGNDRQRLLSLFRPYHSLVQPQHAGSVLSIDDRQPPFEYADGRRLWFYNGIDLGSEAFTVWVHGKDKKGIIGDFYRQLVRNYHDWGLPIPAEVECEMSLNSAFLSTFLKEGEMFQYVHVEANNARGKRIEAYYKPLRYGLEKKREGWLPRPFALSESNQTAGDKKTIIPYDVIVEGCLRDIETWNNSEHSKIKGMSRWDVFLSTQNPSVRPTNYHAILPHLGYRTATSVRVGIIHFRGAEYLLGDAGQVALGDDLIRLMMQVEGKEIDILWLDDNRGGVLKAHVYRGGQYICEAVPKPVYSKARIERTAQDDLARETISKYVSTIAGFGNRQSKALERVIVIDNRPVTVGHSFRMPGLAVLDVDNTPAAVLDDPADALDTDFQADLNGLETSFNLSFEDTF